MNYADYGYYTNEYKGKVLDYNTFEDVITEASRYIDKLTHGRLNRGMTATDEVSMATCAVADIIHRYIQVEKQSLNGIQSENVDGYSVSYASRVEQMANREIDCRRAVDLYLPSSNPLRYAGV